MIIKDCFLFCVFINRKHGISKNHYIYLIFVCRMIITWEDICSSQLNQQRQQKYMVINLLFIVVVLWDYKIHYGISQADTTLVIAPLKGQWISSVVMANLFMR